MAAWGGGGTLLGGADNIYCENANELNFKSGKVYFVSVNYIYFIIWETANLKTIKQMFMGPPAFINNRPTMNREITTMKNCNLDLALKKLALIAKHVWL